MRIRDFTHNNFFAEQHIMPIGMALVGAGWNE